MTLEDNKFVGDLPVEIYNSNIKKLQVGGNSLTGLIKTEIGLMVRLTHFDIGPSKMSGEIPAELYMLTSLEELNLGSSSFSGQVLDTGLGKMLRLRTLILQNNNFNGPFPIGTLENVTTLEEVRMQNNSFVGVITDKVCDSRGREPELLVLDVDCSTVECSCCDGDDCES